MKMILTVKCPLNRYNNKKTHQFHSKLSDADHVSHVAPQGSLHRIIMSFLPFMKMILTILMVWCNLGTVYLSPVAPPALLLPFR